MIIKTNWSCDIEFSGMYLEDILMARISQPKIFQS